MIIKVSIISGDYYLITVGAKKSLNTKFTESKEFAWEMMSSKKYFLLGL
jgi:hypothetical protein